MNIKYIILHVILYECATCSLPLWEEHRLTVFENRVLRKMMGGPEEWNCIKDSLMIHAFHEILSGCPEQGG
jgi:hypothetical protein